MGKVSQKKNLSSMQVIKTLQVLLQDNYTMADLIRKLNQNEKHPVFNNSVISKYINTCRYCGIDIPKIHNKYFVTHVPFGLELTDTDTDILNDIQTVVTQNMSSKSVMIFNNFIQKIIRFSNKDIAKIDKNTYTLSIELFERAVTQKKKVRLLFKNKDILECIPLKIIEVRNKLFFVVYNKKERKVDISRLSGVEVLGTKYIDVYNSGQIVVFKLKGALAKRYTLRENETADYNNDGTVVITNRNEPKEILLSRLMRYDTDCEILKPQSFKDDMKSMIDKTISNYGE